MMQTENEIEIENLRSSVKPTKLRFAVIKTEETYDGILVMPQNKIQQHKLGIVLSMGEEVDVGISENDIVIYQVNSMFEESVTHRVNDTKVLFMHKGDAIGKVTDRSVSVEKFQILGDFILLEEVKISKLGGLFLPDSAIPPPEFRIVQLGGNVKDDDDPVIQGLQVGDEVFVDRSRATVIRLGMKSFFYLPKGWLHGKKKS